MSANNGAGPPFLVIGGPQIRAVLRENTRETVQIVRAAYVAHQSHQTVNPASSFLRFADQPRNRCIALPAHIQAAAGKAITGIKWIASFPGNLAAGAPRASAVVILNDPDTGFPLACLEGSVISASRTAASAVLAASVLNGQQRSMPAVGVVGCGLISSYVYEFLQTTGWSFQNIHLHDRDSERSRRFAERFRGSTAMRVHIHEEPGPVIRGSDLVIFATTAASPYVHDVGLFTHNPLVLHLSLRDLAPEVILAAHNVVDDVDHCLTAATSVHLAEQATGTRCFIQFTLPGILTGAAVPDRTKPIIFSPFGLGILDVAVAQQVMEKVTALGSGTLISDFFL